MYPLMCQVSSGFQVLMCWLAWGYGILQLGCGIPRQCLIYGVPELTRAADNHDMFLIGEEEANSP